VVSPASGTGAAAAVAQLQKQQHATMDSLEHQLRTSTLGMEQNNLALQQTQAAHKAEVRAQPVLYVLH
jgi:hypothetical protein